MNLIKECLTELIAESREVTGLVKRAKAAGLKGEDQKVLLDMLTRADSFIESDDYEDAAEGEDEDILYNFEQWLNSEHSVTLREDGLIEFYDLRDGVDKMIGSNWVVLYHFTSDKLEKKIRKEGLRCDPEVDVNRDGYECLGVYLTTEISGPVVSGYLTRARKHHGGDDMRVEVKMKLSELRPDDNDIDMKSYATQYVARHVSPDRIVEIG